MSAAFIRQVLSFVVVTFVFAGLISCGVELRVDAITSVTPLAGEDLSGPCKYELVLARGANNLPTAQKGALVIFERGDSSVLFNDYQVREMAAGLQFAMIFAHQCDAASYDDVQSEASTGPGRALFQALTQFGQMTGHPELNTASLALYGFSAAGVLAAEMASYAPSRIVGVIAYAAGAANQDIATFEPGGAAFQVPSLFLANSKDSDSGTQRSLTYFSNGMEQKAVWGYGVQPGVGHCCNITTRPILLSWLPAVVRNRAAPSGTAGSFVCSPDGTMDAQGDQDCSITAASITGAAGPAAQPAWLPDEASAEAWLRWITSKSN